MIFRIFVHWKSLQISKRKAMIEKNSSPLLYSSLLLLIWNQDRSTTKPVWIENIVDLER